MNYVRVIDPLAKEWWILIYFDNTNMMYHPHQAIIRQFGGGE
jgi:hypothetical protein